MDEYIVGMWLACIAVYIGIQLFCLRRISWQFSASWQMIIALVFSGFTFVISIYASYLLIREPSMVILSSFLSTLLVIISMGIYMMSIYSYVESSITLKLFMLIGKSLHGVTAKCLRKEYNLAIIVQRRIERLICSGDIVMNKSMINLAEGYSLFSIRKQFIQQIVKKLFP